MHKSHPPESPIPVVLIHGFAEDSNIWERHTSFLGQHHTLIVPDLPGCGKSSNLTAATSMEDLADFIKSLLDGESIGRCIMIGHSMGGYIALAFAEKYPDRLAAFGLFHSTAFADTEEKKAGRRKKISFIQKNGAAPFIRQSIPDLFSESSREKFKSIINNLIEQYSDFVPDTLVRCQEAMIDRPDRTHILKSFKGPVLFIIGKQDNAVPFEQSLRQSHLPDLSYIHILENAGHMGMIENSDECNRVLEEFIAFTLTRQPDKKHTDE